MSTLPLRTVLRLIWSAPHTPEPHRRHIHVTPEQDRRCKQIFAAVAILTLAYVYHFGVVTQIRLRADDLEAIVQADLNWKHRYDVLADSAGEGAVLEAAGREQEEKQ